MAASEFDLIARYFSDIGPPRRDVVLGVGDDCALLMPPPGKLLAVSMDTLVSGVHFLPNADPFALGHKALAVNLSDLAAMGAQPAWATLALTLPKVDPAWLEGFSRGFKALANRWEVQLIGGDTTQGPLSITVQMHGWVAPEQVLRRDSARVGDCIFVTGTLGEAALGVAVLRGELALEACFQTPIRQRLEMPSPRIAQGLDLAGLASSAIDISDGLAQDLGHILSRSGVGAELWLERLPLSPALRSQGEHAFKLVLGGGDDYELCFTVAPERVEQLKQRAAAWDCACTDIGRITAEAGLRCFRPDGTSYLLESAGYEHFR